MTPATLIATLRAERYRTALREVFALIATGADAAPQAVAAALADEARLADGMGSLATDLVTTEAAAWSRDCGRCAFCGEAGYGARS